MPLSSSFVSSECSLDDQEQRPFAGGVAVFQMKKEPSLVVSRGSTRSERTQIADLPPGTMRRISRARSIVSGVELWHPAKTTTRKSRCFCALHHHDRMLMSSCRIAFEHRHHHAY